MRVLYIHMVGAFGGASRSLFETVRAFPPNQIEPIFVAPRGTVGPFFSRLGTVIEARGLTQFDNTRYSYYRGIRWLVLLREISYLPATAIALRRASRVAPSVDIIHVNEITGVIALWLARFWFKTPAIIHVRAVSRVDPASWRTRWVGWMLRRQAGAVIAIDETVRASLPANLQVKVIHNALSVKQSYDYDEDFETKIAALNPDSFKVGFVGNLLRVKGIGELIEAARIVRDSGINVEFLVVGDETQPSRGFKAHVLHAFGLRQSMRAEIEATIERYSLRTNVHMLGFIENIGRAYLHMDVLCFPSHLDAPGRPVLEAALHGVPSIVAVRKPMGDTLIHGETGLAIEARSAEHLAEAITELARDRERTRQMGAAARHLAECNFDVQRNSAEVLQLYRRLVDPIEN